MTKTKIDFWGIGAQKAGTNWLFSNLNKLPEFDLPPIKELHYFDRNAAYPSPDYLEKTLLRERIFDKNYRSKAIRTVGGYLGSKEWKEARFYFKWYFSNYSDQWYLSLFRGFTGFKGEITPSYSILKTADIESMYRISPEAKLIFLLRNPVERAWSQYRFMTRKIKNFDLKKTSNQEIIDFMESDLQVSRSAYLKTIKNFSSVFPKEQILIGFYDALQDKPEQLFTEIVQFITGKTDISTASLGLKKVVYQSKKMDCPAEIEAFLKSKYREPIEQLAEIYGGYFTQGLSELYGNAIVKKDFTATMILK